jgi:hypothetical protein
MYADETIERRLVRIELQSRRLKILLATVILGFLTVGGLAAQVELGERVEASNITFRRPDGTPVAQLKVEPKNELYDITLRDAQGVVRLSFRGLTGTSDIPYSSLGLHDNKGRLRLTLNADEKSTAVGLASAWTPVVINDANFQSPTRVSLQVSGESGSLTFFNENSRPIYSIPIR